MTTKIVIDNVLTFLIVTVTSNTVIWSNRDINKCVIEKSITDYAHDYVVENILYDQK